ncbi:unnamed protein product [Schistosoma mattheei]|uniref:Uncharacterized protein n=1 Tax=Schistosoma mattheei TaxID=31246 RepID=A0A183PAC3_9TREM|nr:unnamed protein product [Schistosoma mattheei]
MGLKSQVQSELKANGALNPSRGEIFGEYAELCSSEGKKMISGVQSIGTSFKVDNQCSAAEIVYGTTLRLPGEFFTPRSRNDLGKSDYVERLSEYIRTWPTVSARIQHRQVAFTRELSTCSHVCIQVDSVRKPLQQPYEGTFLMISRHKMTSKVYRHDRVEVVSIDCPKPAYVHNSVVTDKSRPNARPIEPTSGIPTSTSDPTLDTSDTSFSRPSQQHVSSTPSTDETSISRSDKQTTPPLAPRLRPYCYCQLQPILAKAGLITNAPVNALIRCSGSEFVWHMFGPELGFYGSMWFRPTSAALSGPDPYKRDSQIPDTNRSGLVR